MHSWHAPVIKLNTQHQLYVTDLTKQSDGFPTNAISSRATDSLTESESLKRCNPNGGVASTSYISFRDAPQQNVSGSVGVAIRLVSTLTALERLCAAELGIDLSTAPVFDVYASSATMTWHDESHNSPPITTQRHTLHASSSPSPTHSLTRSLSAHSNHTQPHLRPPDRPICIYN